MKATNSKELQQLLQQLIDRKAKIEEEKNSLSVKEKLEIAFNKKWVPEEKLKKAQLSDKLLKMQQIVLLELAIVESIKNFIPPEVTSLVATSLARVRETNNLLSMNSVSHRYRDNVKIRQVIKLINAVYRYNRDVISGYAPGSELKSRIKHATLCPHCGEDAKYILMNMAESQSVLLPS